MLCPRCQTALDPGAAFCGNCGQQITPQAPQYQPVQNTQAPQPASPPGPAASGQPTQMPLAQPGVPVMPVQPTIQVRQVPQAPSGAVLQQPLQPVTAYASQPMSGYAPQTVEDHSGKAIASFVLAVLGLPGCLIPIIGIVLGVLAIVFGTLSIRSARRVFAIIGMALAVLVLFVSLFLAVRNTQDIIKQRQAGKSVGASSASGPLQSIATPCYTTKIPAGMKVTQTTGSCTFLGVDATAGEQEEVKVLQIPALTASNLPNAAKADVANVVGAIPGGSIGKERTATFAGSQAYQVEIKSTDGSAGIISYVYDTTAQGNLVIILHTQARASGSNYDLSSIESNWAWL